MNDKQQAKREYGVERVNIKQLRLSDDELAQVRAGIQLSGLRSFSDFVRAAIRFYVDHLRG
ncbi:MAG TPA: ribbon-helix-helix protein, CopG family [Smithella sp.]|nr:ribbon-helix-helix protein, CopG family [Smithella sp.]